MTQFINRAYNTLKVRPDNPAVITKRSYDSRLRDEIAYYRNLPSQQAIYFPRMVEGGQGEGGDFELTMEYYAYNNLGNLMIGQYPNPKLWIKVFNFIASFSNQIGERAPDPASCGKMFIQKTEVEYHKLINNFEFFRQFDRTEDGYPVITLNQNSLYSFDMIWPTIRQFLQDECLSEPLRIIHGDLCFSNILYGQNPISGDVVLKFIDPRGSFGDQIIYGDPYYDLAKLLHSCEGGYEYFITDNFELTQRGSDFWLVYANNNGSHIADIFLKTLDPSCNTKKILALQGLIFIGMCARHYDSLERQKAMFLTGLRILNTVYSDL